MPPERKTTTDRREAPDLDLTRSLEETAVLATAETIAAQQLSSGMILWFAGGHADPWNHVESVMALDVAGLTEAAERGYAWLLDAQQAEGWWHHYYVAGGFEDPKIDTNVCSYVAAGVWHHWLLTQDPGFLETMWPVVDSAIDFVITMQRHSGEIIWARHADGTPWSYALLTGSSSIYHSLLCALQLAEAMGRERPLWNQAATKLRDCITNNPDAFEPKHRWAMDWYYPVLSGAIAGQAAVERMAAGRPTFVIEGKGVRCVSDNPWITTAETCECAMAYLNIGDIEAATELFSWVQHLRDASGAYYTGIVYPEHVNFPDAERTTYSGASIILAADAIDGVTPASGLFSGDLRFDAAQNS